MRLPTQSLYVDPLFKSPYSDKFYPDTFLVFIQFFLSLATFRALHNTRSPGAPLVVPYCTYQRSAGLTEATGLTSNGTRTQWESKNISRDPEITSWNSPSYISLTLLPVADVLCMVHFISPSPRACYLTPSQALFGLGDDSQPETPNVLRNLTGCAGTPICFRKSTTFSSSVRQLGNEPLSSKDHLNAYLFFQSATANNDHSEYLWKLSREATLTTFINNTLHAPFSLNINFSVRLQHVPNYAGLVTSR